MPQIPSYLRVRLFGRHHHLDVQPYPNFKDIDKILNIKRFGKSQDYCRIIDARDPRLKLLFKFRQEHFLLIDKVFPVGGYCKVNLLLVYFLRRLRLGKQNLYDIWICQCRYYEEEK